MAREIKKRGFYIELELELIQTQMTQKPMQRVEVNARCVAQIKTDEGGGGDCTYK